MNLVFFVRKFDILYLKYFLAYLRKEYLTQSMYVMMGIIEATAAMALVSPVCVSVQVLFVSCGDARGPGPCREPGARSPLPRACRYHTDAPAHACYAPHKQDSDSDSESMTSDLSPNEVPSPEKREVTEMDIPDALQYD